MPSRFEADKKKRITAVRKALSSGEDGASLKAFADILFAQAAAEDLVEYSPEALAAICREAFAFFRTRPEPVAVRISDVPGEDVAGRSHTAIELSTANRPFIFNSVLGELQASGHAVRLVVHPIIAAKRNEAGEIETFAPRGASPDAPLESFIHVHVPLIADAVARDALDASLTALLSEVRLATDDWRAMRARLRGAIVDFREDHPPLTDAVVEETAAFLQWLEEENFVFLGMREYAFSGIENDAAIDSGTDRARPAPRSERACAASRPGSGDRHAGNPRLPDGPRSADRHQGECEIARPSPRLHGLHRHQALRGRRGHRRAAGRRPVHVDCLQPLGREDPADPRRRSRRSRSARASTRPATRARRCCISSRPIRAPSCSRPTRIRSSRRRWRSCSSKSVRASGRCRGATASTASCRFSSSCRATAIPPICASASA